MTKTFLIQRFSSENWVSRPSFNTMAPVFIVLKSPLTQPHMATMFPKMFTALREHGLLRSYILHVNNKNRSVSKIIWFPEKRKRD